MRCNILVTNTSQSRNVRNERNIPDPGFYRLIKAHWLFLYTDRRRKLKFILQSGKKERYVPFPVFSISGTLLNFGQPDFINVQLIKDVYIYICTHVILSCFSFSLSLSSSRISRSPFCIAGWLESFPRFGGLHVCDFSFYQPMWMHIVLANHGRWLIYNISVIN